MRVIFVGLHNKPNMKPLDSKTKSGKLVDRIIEPLRHRGIRVLKTNLYNTDTLPMDSQKDKLRFDWIERVELFKDDIIILMGAMVHNDFPKIPMITTIKIAHPASKRSHVDMNEYVELTVRKILTLNEALKTA